MNAPPSPVHPTYLGLPRYILGRRPRDHLNGKGSKREQVFYGRREKGVIDGAVLSGRCNILGALVGTTMWAGWLWRAVSFVIITPRSNNILSITVGSCKSQVWE